MVNYFPLVPRLSLFKPAITRHQDLGDFCFIFNSLTECVVVDTEGLDLVIVGFDQGIFSLELTGQTTGLLYYIRTLRAAGKASILDTTHCRQVIAVDKGKA